jgi:hypothetical protein
VSSDELRRQIDRQRSDLGHDLEVLGDRVSPGRMVERRKDAMRSSMTRARDRVMGVAESATSRMSDTAQGIGDTVSGAPAQAREVVAQGSPIAVGLVAFGAGALLAALLPTSDKERRMGQQVTPALERAAGELADAARDEAEQLQPMAKQAVEQDAPPTGGDQPGM